VDEPDASNLRHRIVEALRDTMWLRCRVMRTGSMDDLTDLERAFTPYADAGDYNRRHRDDPIRIRDLVQLEPAIAALTT
jgi:hypothetical protein